MNSDKMGGCRFHGGDIQGPGNVEHMLSTKHIHHGAGMDPVSIGLGKEVQGSMEALRNFLGPQDGNILGKILIQLTPDLQNRKRGSR